MDQAPPPLMAENPIAVLKKRAILVGRSASLLAMTLSSTAHERDNREQASSPRSLENDGPASRGFSSTVGPLLSPANSGWPNAPTLSSRRGHGADRPPRPTARGPPADTVWRFFRPDECF